MQRNGSRVASLIVAVMFWALLNTTLWAQTNTGTISGTVKDSSGAMVPNAQVTITNTSQKTSERLQTNNVGAYVAPSLSIGSYDIQVQGAGFRSSVRKNVLLHVNEHLGLDFTLVAGGSNEVVEVTTQSPIIDTQSADVGQVVEARTVQDLPLDGRRYIDLMLLAPGAVQAAGLRSNPREGRFNIDGNLSLQNNFVLNGVDNNTFSENAQDKSPQAVRPVPDAIQEFKVQTRTYTADFGWAMGAVVNAEIKSGSNQLHGSGWFFNRNDHLDAIDYFAKRVTPVIKPRELRNQYGFTVGGPVLKDRTFWFFDYEHTHSFKGQVATGAVPTAGMKQGIFPSDRPLTDPSALIPLIAGCVDTTRNVINLTALRTDGKPCGDPAGIALAQLYPDPNSGEFTYTGSPLVPNNQDSLDARIDHRLSSHDNLTFTYDYYQNDGVDQRGPFPNPLATGGFSANFHARGQLASAGWTHTFRPNLLNDFRAGFNRVFSIENPLPGNKNLGPQFGLTNLPAFFPAGLPPINVSGYSKLGTSEWRPQTQTSQVYQFLDSLSYLRGNHSMKFGFEYKHMLNNFLDIMAPNGQINLNNAYTGDGVADLLLGLVSDVAATTPIVPHNYVNGWMLYGQDSFRITPKLTVNYGIRYEYFTPLIERERKTSNFSPTANGGQGALLTAFKGPFAAPTCTFNCLIQVTGDSLYDRTLINPDRNNFAPRLGIAYQAAERVVVRGGFGIFYQALDRQGSSGLIQLNPPQDINFNFARATSSEAPKHFLRDPFPTLPTAFDPTKIFLEGRDPNERSPYSEQWSIGPEVQLAKDIAVDLAYVGQQTHRLRKLYNLNQGSIVGGSSVVFPYPDFNPAIEYVRTNGRSNYNAFQAQVRKRMAKGFAFNLSYTWSKALGDVTDNLSTGTTSSQEYPQNINDLRADYGRLNFDQRQRWVLNWVYELPFGPGKARLSNGAVSKILGGWQFNGIYSYNTGVPVTIGAPDRSNTVSFNSRADQIGDPLPSGFSQSVDHWFNTAAFADPAAFTFGNSRVGVLSGPSHNNWDLSLFKKIPVTERINFEFRTEFFNAFNHAQFDPPDNFVLSPTFGQVTQTADPDKPARVIQFGLKMYW
jgi:hypothetical protein